MDHIQTVLNLDDTGCLLTEEQWTALDDYMTALVMAGVASAIGDQNDTLKLITNLSKAKQAVHDMLIEGGKKKPVQEKIQHSTYDEMLKRGQQRIANETEAVRKHDEFVKEIDERFSPSGIESSEAWDGDDDS